MSTNHRTGPDALKRNPKPPQKPKKKKKMTWKKGMLWLFFTVAFAIFCAIAGYLWIMLNGERILKESDNKYGIMSETSIIYDVNNKEVGKLYAENREPVELKDVPKMLQDAFIATEDRRFNEHQGVDLWSIGRAAVKDIIARSKVEGGSTITQQLAKNLFLSHDKTFFRKATEVSIALALENHNTKEEILAMYLNRIFFGKNAYGIKAASIRYFGKSNLNDLKLWEMATLAGIPKAPSNYNPLSNPEKSKERRGIVLKLMYDQGYITKAQMDEAALVEYDPEQSSDAKNVESPFVDYALVEAMEKTKKTEEELRRGGYKIYTTMDLNAQKIMETAFANDDFFEKSKDAQLMQGAMVIMDHRNGSIVAMVGGRDYVRKGLNRVTVPRQPGSTFKPIASYGPALETGNFFPWSTVRDDKQCFGKYCPRDLGSNKYIGAVSFTDALKRSINLPSVWLLNEVGIDKGVKFAESLGIPMKKEDRNLAIALGGLTYGASPLQMANAFSAFANGGKLNTTYSISKITDSEDKVIYEMKKPEMKQVMRPQTAYYMTDVLQQVVTDGTGKRAKFSHPVAGKTGTTQHGIPGFSSSANRDVWFVGYTTEWTGAVWMGYDKTDRDHVVKQGSGQAATLFKEVMSKALAKHKPSNFKKPEGIEEVKPPQAVSGLMASYSASSQSVTLNWGEVASDKPLTYRVYRKESTESKFTMVSELASNAYEDIEVVPNAQYEYYVTAYSAAMKLETPPSSKVKIKIENDLPPITVPNQPDPNNPNVDPNNPGTVDPNDPWGNPDPNAPDPNNPTPNSNPDPNGQTGDQTGTVNGLPGNDIGLDNGDGKNNGKGKERGKGHQKEKDGNID